MLLSALIAVGTYIGTQFIKSQERKMDLKRKTYMALWEAWRRLELAAMTLPNKIQIARATAPSGEDVPKLERPYWRALRELADFFKILEEAEVCMEIIKISASAELLDELLKVENCHNRYLMDLVKMIHLHNANELQEKKQRPSKIAELHKASINELTSKILIDQNNSNLRIEIPFEVDREIFQQIETQLDLEAKCEVWFNRQEFLKKCLILAQILNEFTIRARALMRHELIEEESWSKFRKAYDWFCQKPTEMTDIEFCKKLFYALRLQKEMDIAVLLHRCEVKRHD